MTEGIRRVLLAVLLEQPLVHVGLAVALNALVDVAGGLVLHLLREGRRAVWALRRGCGLLLRLLLPLLLERPLFLLRRLQMQRCYQR